MDQTTNFANSKKRVIRISAQGKPFVMTNKGKRSYEPKAAFRKNAASGALVKLVKGNSVPKALAPARLPAAPKPTGAPRKVRSNKGMKRGPREATLYKMVFGNKKMPGAPRKVRSNKGTKRKLISTPRQGLYKGRAAATRRQRTEAQRKLVAQNPFASLMRRM
jgi:hypothetical protein